MENIAKNHLSAEEIEKSVQELLKENTELKGNQKKYQISELYVRIYTRTK